LDTEVLARARALLRECAFVCPHTDADGLAAGAIALRLRGEGADAAVLLKRGQTPFDGSLPAGEPVAILDWGIRDLDRSCIYVDHHAPETEPRSHQLAISGAGSDPERSTSALMHLIDPAAPAWLAAVGAVGDLGKNAWKLPQLEGVTKSPVQKLVPLVNAPRRLPSGPVRTALALLVESDSARAALEDPRIAELEEAKAEWRSGFDRALRTAPQVDRGVAVIRFTSPYQVHPLVAQTWARRLAPNVVIAANDDYLPGKVNFAVRGGSGNLRDLLHDALPGDRGEFAHGHDRATGGSLAPQEFEQLIENLRSKEAAA
jgi:single-stranded-DNA-specific exonuclease